MKKLIIIRHAKSSWDDPFMYDQDRPLAARGLRDAPKMGQRLKKRGLYPDMILSSDAERAKATAQIIAEQLHFPKNSIVYSNKLYHASSYEILEQIRAVPQAVELLLVFGHNPGINDLIWELDGELDNLPTAGQFGIIFHTDNWLDIGKKNAEVWFDDYPKKNG